MCYKSVNRYVITKFYLTFPQDTRNGAYSFKQQEEERKRKAYQDLPDTFQTKEAVAIGKRHGLSERTVKRWLKTSLFTSLSYLFNAGAYLLKK